MDDRDDMESPVAKLVMVVLLKAVRSNTWFVDFGPTSVQFFTEGRWQDELVPPRKLSQPMVHMICKLVELAPPPRDLSIAGRFQLEIGSSERVQFLVSLSWRRDDLCALLERVSEDDYYLRAAPRLPVAVKH